MIKFYKNVADARVRCNQVSGFLTVVTYSVHVECPSYWLVSGVFLIMFRIAGNTNHLENQRRTTIFIIYFDVFSVSTFLMLVGHSDSEDLPETDLFHPSLKAIFKNQNEIEKLASNDCFISVGYLFNPHQLTFHEEQKTVIKKWIKVNILVNLITNNMNSLKSFDNVRDKIVPP